MQATDYEKILNNEKAVLSLIMKEKKECEEKLSEAKRMEPIIFEALEIVNSVLQNTQVQIKSFIEEVVTLALQTVFGLNYSFQIDYEIKRNKSEANIYVIIDGNQYEMEEVGGGVVDVCAFGLRVALWALADNPEPIMILDEPARCLSIDKQEVFAEMLSKISKMFNIQMIIVSHSADIIGNSDKAFVVKMTDGVSNVIT